MSKQEKPKGPDMQLVIIIGVAVVVIAGLFYLMS